jgi:hypothetical protein
MVNDDTAPATSPGNRKPNNYQRSIPALKAKYNEFAHTKVASFFVAGKAIKMRWNITLVWSFALPNGCIIPWILVLATDVLFANYRIFLNYQGLEQPR